MKRKALTIISILIITLISACGPAPEPTLPAVDVQNTAIADAWTAVALTQAAMPTATETLVPTATTTPTLQPTFTAAPTLVPPTAAATESVCNQPPPIKPLGVEVKVKFVNKSGGNVNLSFGMNSPNDKGECITYSYTLGVFDEPVVTVLSGCYWAYAWVDGKEPSTAQTIDLLCIKDPAKQPAVWITKEVISFH